MKNIDKYKDELLNAIRDDMSDEALYGCHMNAFFDKHVAPEYNIQADGHYLAPVALIMLLWLEEEYKEPEVDWSKVAVDTPILVRDTEKEKWHKRYFAKFKNGVVTAWYNGATSWSEEGKSSREWRQAKLAEEKDGSNQDAIKNVKPV